MVFAFYGSLNLLALAAFAPALARSFWFLAKPTKQINLKRLGALEIMYSVVFLIFIALTFHAS